jgi:hypothetical protein
LIIDYDEDYSRYLDFLQEKYPGRSELTDEEHDMAFEEYEELFPMNLVLYRTRWELIFYNRPVGEVVHFWRLPWDFYIWEKGDFFGLAKEVFQIRFKQLFERNQ